MSEKLYYWAKNLENYFADNDQDFNQVIEIKRLNFFIGKNNAGKSRFLRQLFQNSTHFKEFQKYNLQTELDRLLDYIQKNEFRRPTKQTDSSRYSDGTSNVMPQEKSQIASNLSYINSIKFKYDQIKNNISQIQTTLQSYKLHSENSKEKLNDIFNDMKNKMIQIEQKQWFSNGKFYIPILRGMRPVTNLDNKQPYIERAQKDYFHDDQQFNSSNIITGECLYHELKVHLLGEPEQRDLIKKYEEKLCTRQKKITH